MQRFIAPVAVLVVFLGASTYWHGLLTERWGVNHSERLLAFTERLENVPLEVGDWKSEEAPIDAEQLDAANVTGCYSRVFTNQITGEQVNMFLVCGTKHHITAHTPDWCYRAAGFEQQGDHMNYPIDVGQPGPAPNFATGHFVKREKLQTQELRIFWAFSDSPEWIGPREPRITLAGYGALYKVYFITAITKDGDRSPEDSPSIEFAKVMMPVLNDVLFKEEQQETPVADASSS